ncbi:hypothetical protein ANANG_G00282180 [Anguilla anguilla]|uniref:Ig-like domain-containing protein n=1 Tax=Anguilla anguilla TaxID=7936 RepID=A0A9D3LNK4_ANGAN|nr:hypothetical protein ANANG_G00282180 [Anguilla anguilla]
MFWNVLASSQTLLSRGIPTDTDRLWNPPRMSVAVAKAPPGFTLDITDLQIQEAAIRIQASYRGHRSRKELREKGPPKILQALKDVDGAELKDGPKYRYVFEDPDVVALVVRDGTVADLGQYTVTIKNTFGLATGSARIIVEAPAKITKGPDNLKVVAGATVVLKADISGEPPPDVGWLKEGEDIEEDDRVFYDIGETSTILTIKHAQHSDAGKYEVFVENNLGTDQSFTRVDVL